MKKNFIALSATMLLAFNVFAQISRIDNSTFRNPDTIRNEADYKSKAKRILDKTAGITIREKAGVPVLADLACEGLNVDVTSGMLFHLQKALFHTNKPQRMHRTKIILK